MSHRREKRARQAARAARAAMMTAISLDMLAIAMPSGAQEAQNEQTQNEQTTADEAVLEEVVVSGFRASLEESLQVKRESNLIVETVSAEDIAKFPDQNISESLQRLPGVQIERAFGQGTRVLIRGLPQNVVTLNGEYFLNGFEMFAVGEGAGGGGNRGVDSLEGVPSELLGAVDVYKSPNASMVEGGLGGSVDLRTRSALDMPGGLTLGGNLRYGQSTYLEDWEPVAALGGGYNFENNFGITASIAYDKQAFHEDELAGNNRGNWRFIDGLSLDPASGDLVPNNDERNFFRTTGVDYISPELVYTNHRDQYRERIGASLGFDWKPMESLTTGFNWFHSDTDISTEEVGNKVWFTSNNLGRGMDPSQPFEVDSNGVVLNGTFRALGAEVISFVQASDIQADNFSMNVGWDNGGPLRARFRATYSNADLTSDAANSDVQKAAYAVPTADPSSPTGWSHQAAFNPTAPGGPSNTPYSFRYENNGTLPSVTYGAPFGDLLTNPAYSMFKSHWAFGFRNELDTWSVRSDLQFDPPFIESDNVTLSGGLRLGGRDVDFVSGRYLLDWSSTGAVDGHALGLEFGPWFYFQDAAIGNRGCDLAAGTPGHVDCGAGRFAQSPLVVGSVEGFLTNPSRVETINDFFPSGNVGNAIIAQDRSQMRNPAAWLQSLYPSATMQFFEDPIESFVLQEDVQAAYLMMDIGQPADNFHLNVGARVVHTELNIEQHSPIAGGRYWGSDSWNGVTRDFETGFTDRSYTDILPSANAVLDVTDQHKVRFSAARVMGRQNPFDLGRGFARNFTRVTRDGVEGFEFTSGTAGNPDLEPFRASQVDLAWEYYFGRQGLVAAAAFYKEVDSFVFNRSAPEVVADDFGGTAGAVNRPFNGTGGNIQGFELGGQYAFSNGFGFNVNYTFADSESPFESVHNGLSQSLPIPGVAEHAVNTQVYYENFGFQARLSYSWRDKSLSTTNTLFAYEQNVDAVWLRDYGQLDAQLGYALTDNIVATLEGINLTEEDQSQYLQFPNQPFTFNSGSRRILIGVRGTFGGNVRR
jgi:iron complex outermembrane recepter protein